MQILRVLTAIAKELSPKSETSDVDATQSTESNEVEADADTSNVTTGEETKDPLPLIIAYYDVMRYFPVTRRPRITPVKAPEYLVHTSKLHMYSLDYRPIELPKPVRRSKDILKYAPINIKTSRPRQAYLLLPFYCHALDYQYLNNIIIAPDFHTAARFVVAQSDLSKVMRWSYRYNTLHRKTVMNSHKLTSAKKLLGPGFFDSTSTKGNIWFSDKFSRDGNLDSSTMLKTLNTQWNSMYRTNLTQQTQETIGNLASRDIQNNFNFLSNYETSFHFFVKRAHAFSTLRSNTFTTTLKLNSNPKVGTSTQSMSPENILVLLANSLSRSHTTASGVLNPFYSRIDYSQLKKFSPTPASKDVVSPSWDYDFLTDDQLELMYNTTTMITATPVSTSFFKLHGHTTYAVDSELDFIVPKSPFKVNQKPYSTLLANEEELLKDMYLLSLLWGHMRKK
jgi:hypothetical protein